MRRDEGPSLLAVLTKAKHVASLIHECWQCRLASPRGEASEWLLWLACHEASETRQARRGKPQVNSPRGHLWLALTAQIAQVLVPFFIINKVSNVERHPFRSSTVSRFLNICASSSMHILKLGSCSVETNSSSDAVKRSHSSHI